MKTAKAKLAAVPTKRHVVGLLTFCEQTGIPLETIISAIERRNTFFTEKLGLVLHDNGYGVDLNIYDRNYAIGARRSWRRSPGGSKAA